MQVRFTHLGCFIEEEGHIIAQGRREGNMFIVDTNEVGTTVVKILGHKGKHRRIRGNAGVHESTPFFF